MKHLKKIIAGCLTAAAVFTMLPASAAEWEAVPETVDEIEPAETNLSDTSFSDTEVLDAEVSEQEYWDEIIEDLDENTAVENFDNEDEADIAEPETMEDAADIDSLEDTEDLLSEEEDDAEEVQYLNGIPVDYEDPDCRKWLSLMEGNSIATYASSTTSEYQTTWNGVTYYHSPTVASDKSILPGIDVSKWQGNIDWAAVASSGIKFAFIREAYTEFTSFDQNMDEYYEINMQGAAAAGIPHGVYFRSQAITVSEAIAEAEYCLSHLGGYSFELPIIMDYEIGDNTGRMNMSYPDAETQTKIVNAFCETIEAAGYRCMLYANVDQMTQCLNASEIPQSRQLWLARYTTGVPNYDGTYEFWQCGQTNVDGISAEVDLDWWYTTVTDIVKINGKWVYVVNGMPDYTYTGLAQNSNGWWYVKDGVVDFTYNGFASNGSDKWYVENGEVTFQKNSVIQDDTGAIGTKGTWWYVVGSEVQTSFTGLADYSNSNGWWYIKNGQVDFTKNTVAQNKNGWWYVTDGKVQFGFTGLADYSNSNGWWYIKNGQVDFTHNGVDKNKNGWWYVLNGKVQFGFTGLADYSNSNGWWYIQDGKVDFTKNTVAKNKNGWWYVLDGKVQFGFTGLADYPNSSGWWYIKNGKVDFTHSGVDRNKNGWWYIEGGKVNFNFNGIANNSNGWWYIKNGKVDFTYNGTVTASGITYRVTNGKVAR